MFRVGCGPVDWGGLGTASFVMPRYAKGTGHRTSHTPPPALVLTEYIDDRLHEQLNLETLAAVAGLGVWTFTRHFRASLAEPHALTLSSGVSIGRDACSRKAVYLSRR